MQLGPLQKEWISSMKAHPERKGEGTLARFEGENYHACCLGELHICYHRLNNLELPKVERDGQSRLSDHKDPANTQTAILGASHEKYGLEGPAGEFSNEVTIEGVRYSSLVRMNDSKNFTWPEIAEFIENNPELIFNRSV